MRLRRGVAPLGALATTAVLAAAVSAVTAPVDASSAAHESVQQSGGHRQPAPRLDHIFVIMLENHSKSSVIGDPNAPYLTHLARTHAMADRYYGVTHPSMPNYIATIAGDNFGIQDDEDENVRHLDRRNLVDQLENHSVRWAAYMESLPKNKQARFSPSEDVPLYAKKHNPFVLFSDIKHNADRMRHVRNYNRLAGDLNRRRAPHFVWISPNQCHDMHGGVYTAVPGHPETPCPYGSTRDDPNDAALKHKADRFVHQTVRTIRQSDAWTSRSAIVIVTDENDYTGKERTGGWGSAAGCCDSPYVAAADPRISPQWPGGTYGGGRIPAIIISPSGPHHYVDHRRYNHYSLLTTIEENWHMSYLGHAGDTAGDVYPMWRLFDRRR
ncbi:MAG: alkaline phosphatase family protein [Nocardioidaceae bacterium]